MLFTTSEQFVVLTVVLLSGWLIGFASAPNAAKWKRRARAQADSSAAYHRDAEDKLRAAQQRATDLKDELASLRADHADAEQTIARLRSGAKHDVTPEVVPATVAPPHEPVVEADNGIPHARVDPRPGREDLTRIRGIDALLATRLFSLGLVRFEDIEKLSAADEIALEQRLALPAGLIARDEWRAQAAALRAGSADAPGENVETGALQAPEVPPPPPA
ncbi:hypothetical protein [Sphingomonas sp. PWP1-2]|uniref:hypothetical protein n=1 Tax=Sphingomonas sp. PWP1-2 TaxID=2804558 RepID=UPI003CF1E645